MTTLSWSTLRALSGNEVRNVARDPLLRWMVPVPLVYALLVRWAVPLMARNFGLDLGPYAVLITSALLVLMAPLLLGFVLGMLLLDERDGGTLQALRVTPLSLDGYLALKLGMPLLICAALSLACVPLAGLVALRPAHLPVALLTSLEMPLVALGLAAFAGNKVQGFALIKASNLILLPPIAAYFMTPPWDLIFGLIPIYWPLKAFWIIEAGGAAWPYLAVGLVVHLIALAILARRFRDVAGRGAT